MRKFPWLSALICGGVALRVLGSGRPPAPDPTPQDGEPPRVAVNTFAREYGFRDVDSEQDRLVLTGEVHRVELYRDSRRCVINGTLFWLNEPLVKTGRRWTLAERDVDLTLAPVLRPPLPATGAGYEVVVLDPGHGGGDSGAVSPTGLMEKEVVLDIARRVRALLTRQGVRVYLTRHDDRFLELAERPRRAATWDADLFVSLHANSGGPSARGTESFVLALPGSRSTNQRPDLPAPMASHPGNRSDAANAALAYALHHELVQVPGLADRGVRRARFQVLREAAFPAALVETGFLSHPEEGERFRESAFRQALAESIARGIDNYLRAVKTAVMTETTLEEDD